MDRVTETVRMLIDRHAAAHPDRPFLIAPDTGLTVTWGALRAAVRAFAGALDADGVPAGAPVSFMMRNSWGSVLAILGTMYAGRITAPVNLAAGDPQIAYVLGHSGTGLLLVGPDEKPRLTEILKSVPQAVRVVDCAYDGSPDWTAGDTLAPDTTVAADGLLMYTSGTTGNPKGALLSQRAALSGGLNAIIAHELTDADRVLLVLPLYHINGFCVSLMSTVVGGTTIVVPPRFSVSEFWGLIAAHDCSWVSAVPTQYQYLLRAAEADGPPDRSGLGRLRFLRSVSAPLSPDVHRAVEALFGVVLIETMGLTECAAQISSNPMPPGARKYGSPGKAYGNALAILDGGAEAGRGVEGEIAVRGDNVFRIYKDNPDATAEAFTADGWFLTGDLGKMDADGYVYVTGRRKELIIKGGENIAPREIDEALLAHPDVVEAAAFAIPDSDYGQRVSAAVKLTEEATVTEADLLALTRTAVGSFKAPDRVHILPDLPKGPSGKVQRLRLADMMT